MDTEKYDVGLVTCGFAGNYGAVFTAYALYKTLQRNGYKTLFLDKPKFWWPDYYNNEKNLFTRNFLKKHIEYFSEEFGREDLNKLSNVCNQFVVGSDQLWNYVVYNDSGHYLQLDFVKDKNKKISYATSFGHDILYVKGKEKHVLGSYLKRFDNISVREKSGVRILNEEFNINAKSVLDPVFLLSRSDYDDLAKESTLRLPKNYLFVYMLDSNQDKIYAIEKICKKRNLKKVLIVNDYDNDKLEEGDILLRIGEASPEDFIFAIKNSKVVFTDSFHGTCFSLIYNKQFIALKNKGRGQARFDDLFEFLELGDVGLSIEEFAYNGYEGKEVNYDSYQTMIKKLKEESLNWLLSALKEEKTTTIESEFYKEIAQLLPDIIEERRLLTSIGEVGLGEGVLIHEIVERMPNNSVLCQVQGRMGEPIIDTPEPYGVLTITKTTDYFVQILFSQMTLSAKKPQLFQANWIKGDIRGWTRYVEESELKELEERIKKLEKLNNKGE